jgi:hypothetical protein
MRSAPHSRLSLAISLPQRHGLSGYLWFGHTRSRFVLPEQAKSLAMPSEQRLWLDNEQGLFPGLNRPRQKNQEHPVRFATGGSFHLSAEDNELLAKKRVLCYEFGPAPGKVGQCQEQERGGVRFCPVDETVVEQLKTTTCQPLDEDENPTHNVLYPFTKMSKRMR